MSTGRQLALDLGHRPALGREDFLVTAANGRAVATIDRWPDWPGSVVAINGPAGCGKSHLGAVWRAASGGVELAAADLHRRQVPELLGSLRACLVDGAGAVAGSADSEESLLHLYNVIVERRGGLLLLDRAPPARWPVRLPDLRSRLRAAYAVEIGAPDDALIEAVLVKLFADRQIAVEPAVIGFLVRRMERSLDAARRIVAHMDRAALAGQRPVTVPLARVALEDLQEDRES